MTQYEREDNRENKKKEYEWFDLLCELTVAIQFNNRLQPKSFFHRHSIDSTSRIDCAVQINHAKKMNTSYIIERRILPQHWRWNWSGRFFDNPLPHQHSPLQYIEERALHHIPTPFLEIKHSFVFFWTTFSRPSLFARFSFDIRCLSMQLRNHMVATLHRNYPRSLPLFVAIKNTIDITDDRL